MKKMSTSNSQQHRGAKQPGIIEKSISWLTKKLSIIFPEKKRRTPTEEGFKKPIRVKLGPINIHVVGIPGDRRYHEAKLIAEEVKQVFDEYPITIQLTDVSSKAEGAYPRIYLDKQLWYVGRIDYEMLFFEVHHLLKQKEHRISKMKEYFKEIHDKHRYFIIYSNMYFEIGIDSNRTRLIVPAKHVGFEVKNLQLVLEVRRRGDSYSIQLHQSLLWNNQQVFDLTPYDGEPIKLEQVFMADGTIQWLK